MKKFKHFIASFALLFMVNTTANSQVLISLLLGDKLNSPYLEFGLDGGINWLDMTNTPISVTDNTNAKTLRDWNLGFYFDFKFKKHPSLYIHTGVLVKSKMGCADLAPYTVNNSDSVALGNAFDGGNVDRKINYFNVPILLRYDFYKGFFIGGGIQLGLRYTAFDLFQNSVPDKDDLQYTYDTKDNYAHLDAGGEATIGYKFHTGPGMTIHFDYYYGLVDVNKSMAGTQSNSAFYINASIPIGKKKAAREAAEKAAQEKAN